MLTKQVKQNWKKFYKENGLSKKDIKKIESIASKIVNKLINDNIISEHKKLEYFNKIEQNITNIYNELKEEIRIAYPLFYISIYDDVIEDIAKTLKIRDYKNDYTYPQLEIISQLILEPIRNKRIFFNAYKDSNTRNYAWPCTYTNFHKYLTTKNKRL